MVFMLISCVISAIAIIITRMTVDHGELALEIVVGPADQVEHDAPAEGQARHHERPRCQARRWSSHQHRRVPAVRQPEATAMITQPMVSSKIAEANDDLAEIPAHEIISRINHRHDFTDEIDSAVPRKIAVTRRASGFGNSEPSQAASRRAQAARSTAARRRRWQLSLPPRWRSAFTSCKSVSMPVSSSSIRLPSCDTAIIMLSALGRALDNAGPRGRPDQAKHRRSEQSPMSCPITARPSSRCAALPISGPPEQQLELGDQIELRNRLQRRYPLRTPQSA